MRLRIRHIPLIVLIAFQTITQLFWLPTAAHSGQVAIPWMMNQGKLLFGHLLEQHAPGSTLIAALAQRLLPLEPLAVAQILNVLLLLALLSAVSALPLVDTLARRLLLPALLALLSVVSELSLSPESLMRLGGDWQLLPASLHLPTQSPLPLPEL